MQGIEEFGNHELNELNVLDILLLTLILLFLSRVLELQR